MSTTGVCLLLFFAMIPLSLRNMVPVSVCSLRPLFQLTSCNFYCCFALALSTRQLLCFFRRQLVLFRRQLVVMFRRQQRQRKQREERAQRSVSRGDIQQRQQDYCCQLVFFVFSDDKLFIYTYPGRMRPIPGCRRCSLSAAASRASCRCGLCRVR